MKREAYGGGDLPGAECAERKQQPHGNGAAGSFRAIGINPGDDLREQHNCCETEIDDEQQVPSDALLRERIPDARAEGCHRVEKNVTANCYCVDDEENSPGRGFPVAKVPAFFCECKSRASEPRKKRSEKRQCDERVGDGAMIFDDRERIAREDFLDDINIREHRAYGGGKSCDAAVTLREKALADKRADNSVSYGVHERFEKVRVYTIARKSNDFEKR